MVFAELFLPNIKSKVLGKNTSPPSLLTRAGTCLPEGRWKEWAVKTQSGVPDCECRSSHKQWGSLINYGKLDTGLREYYSREISKSYLGNSFLSHSQSLIRTLSLGQSKTLAGFSFSQRERDQRTFLLRSIHATSSPESFLHAFLSYVRMSKHRLL